MSAVPSAASLPEPPRTKLTGSHKALIVLIAFLLAAKLLETILHIQFRVAGQSAAFAWRPMVLYVATALLGAGFAHVVGFPGMWETGVSNRGRIWAPLGIGIAVGAALLAIDRASGFAHLYATTFGVPSLALPFSAQVLFQLFAAVSTGILYTLFGIAFTLWFFGTLLLSRHWPTQMFWVVALVVSLWEPWVAANHGHWALLRMHPMSIGVVAILALLYALDLTAAILFRKFGFTAALVLRISAFAVWHIIGRV